MKKKLLTLSDLEDFYSTHVRASSFSSQKSGYQLAVQVPADFEVDEDNTDDTLVYATVRCFHTGVNRNKSNVTHEAAEKAMKTMSYKPILANFYTDPETGIIDFTSHDIKINDDDTITYQEKQVGCFTADEPWFEEIDGVEFVCARCAIPRDYTETVSILERKNGSKTSVELLINEMNFSPKEGILNLTDITVHGQTLLGTNPYTGEEVQEGMKGARVDIQDFAASKNSLFSSINEETNQKLIDTLNALNATLKSFDNTSIQKGGKDKNMFNKELFESLLVKYSVTTEQVEFEYENLNDEELEAAFAEHFDESKKDDGTTEPSGPVEPKANPETDPEDEPTPAEPDGGEDPESNPEDGDGDGEGDNGDGSDDGATSDFSKTFSLSHEDVRCGLYSLLTSYEEMDNEWYYIEQTFDDHFIYSGMFEGKIWSQGYSKNDVDNTVAFEGERTEMFRELLTASEKAELEEMRANYASLYQFKQNYDLEAARSEKREILSAECYSSIADKAEFVELMKDENLDKFSKDAIQDEADKICGKYARLGQFSFNEGVKPEPEKPKKSVVVTMFGAQKHESSFLEGLRDMYKAK